MHKYGIYHCEFYVINFMLSDYDESFPAKSFFSFSVITRFPRKKLPTQKRSMKSYVITSSCDSAGYEMLYLLYAITRNKYVDSGTKFWYDIVYSWTAPSSVLASIFHLSSSKMKRCKRIQNMIGILLNQFNVFE